MKSDNLVFMTWELQFAWEATYCLPPLPEDEEEPDDPELPELYDRLLLPDDPDEKLDEDLELLPDEKLLLFVPELVPRLLGVEYEEPDLLPDDEYDEALRVPEVD